MKSFLSKIIAFLILAICIVGCSSTIAPALAHDASGPYEAGYERGYQHGYNMAIRTRFQDRATKTSLNPTALKLIAPTVQVCTKASMPGFRAGSGHHQHGGAHGLY